MTISLQPRRIAMAIGMLVVIVWPWVGDPSMVFVNDATRAWLFALVAVSLVLLTGWVGQISLAQAAFVGIGAIGAALIARTTGLPFPFSLPLAVGMATGAAVLLGVVALRVRGLYLAVATLIFAWMADAFLFPAPWFTGVGGSAQLVTPPIGTPGTVPSFNFVDPRIMYLVALAALATGILVAANLRDSKTGRAFFALRGSEVAAASLGINVTRHKLVAFGVSGAMAGLAGNVQMVWQGSVVPDDFNFLASLFFLAIAVVGGISSLPGAVAGGLLFSALSEVFFRVPQLNGYIELVSGGLLLVVLLAYPGGLATAGRRLRLRAFPPEPADDAANGDATVEADADTEDPTEALREELRELRREVLRLRQGGEREEVDVPDVAPDAPNGDAPAARVDAAAVDPPTDPADDPTDELEVGAVPPDEPAPVLDAAGVTVRFGGLTAVDAADLRVDRGEIVGLIGPNGAGKTTLFNAITGLILPDTGQVRLFGQDASQLPVHQRAALGVGRTFQVLQLFPHLDVFDNVLVGTHLQDPTGFLHHLVVSSSAVAAERSSRARVAEIVDLLDLGDIAHRHIAELPFGTLRLVELARALATGAPFIMLDEAASGLDNTETDELVARLVTLRDELDLSILVIEHDVRMVTGISDRMYVLDRGQMIASGTPDEIRRDAAVIAAYLGGGTEAADDGPHPEDELVETEPVRVET